MTTTAHTTTDGRVPTTLRWTPRIKAALRAEAQRRNSTLSPREKPWNDATVSEDILRQALGVGNE